MNDLLLGGGEFAYQLSVRWAAQSITHKCPATYRVKRNLTCEVRSKLESCLTEMDGRKHQYVSDRS